MLNLAGKRAHFQRNRCSTSPVLPLNFGGIRNEIRDTFAKQGYRLPAIVYWNVNSRGEQFPVRRDENGTVLVSGASPSIFRMVIGQNTSPEEYMYSILNGERYLPICA